MTYALYALWYLAAAIVVSAAIAILGTLLCGAVCVLYVIGMLVAEVMA